MILTIIGVILGVMVVYGIAVTLYAVRTIKHIEKNKEEYEARR